MPRLWTAGTEVPGLAWHIEGGIGYALADASKEVGLEAMEAGIGRRIDLDTDDDVCFFLGAGVDYFFTHRTSLGVGLRHWWMQPDYDLTAEGLGNIEKGSINANTLQVLISLTYRFGH